MGAVGSAAAALFGVFWTVAAVQMGAPGIFPLFGVLFVILGAVQAVYNFKKAAGKNRCSAFDITDDGEEPDPLEERFGGGSHPEGAAPSDTGGAESFCPYCGAPAEPGFVFCRKCGKKLPAER
jgi:hypothetical protein